MNNLMVYFSWSNNTKKLVEKVNQKFNFDVVRIERTIPYSTDYDKCAYVEAKEEVEKKIHPAIKDINVDINKYDNILLFFPIWWYTFPMPIGTFLEQIKGFQGKVYLFANSYTNDPQYMTNSLKDCKKIDAKMKFETGLFNKSIEEHLKFIGGLK